MFVRRCGPRELRLYGAKLLGEVVGGTRQRTLRGESVDQTEQLVMIVNGWFVERIDEGAAVHLIRDPSFALEHDKCFAHRYTAHAQLLGNGILRHPHTRPQLTLEDQPPNV